MKRLSTFLLLTLLLLVSGGAITTTTRAQSSIPEGSGFADVNGARIYYEVTGRGEPMVLIHGYPLNNGLFIRQREELRHRFQVITLDLRGFGRSIAPDDQASIDVYARDVLALMDAIGLERAIIGGHSMGGITTLNIYRLAPERFTGMLLIDSVLIPPPTVEQFMWRGYQQQSREQGAESLIPLLLPEFLTGPTRLSNPDLVAEVSNLIRQASLNGLVGGARALETRPDLRGVFPTITVPTLLLFGVEDSLTPVETAQAAQAAIPGSELAIIPKATHGAIRERAQLANLAILQWAAQNFGVRGGFASLGN